MITRRIKHSVKIFHKIEKDSHSVRFKYAHKRLCKFYVIEGHKKVQVGKDQEKAQSEKDSHSKNRGGEKTN